MVSFGRGGWSSGRGGSKEAAGRTGVSDPSGSWSSICRWVPLIANSPWSWREWDIRGNTHSTRATLPRPLWRHAPNTHLKANGAHCWWGPRLGRTTALYNGLERYYVLLIKWSIKNSTGKQSGLYNTNMMITYSQQSNGSLVPTVIEK